MNIFIWNSYGDVSVYPAETVEECRALLNTVIDCLDGWGLEAKIKKARAHADKTVGDDPGYIRAAINYLLGEAGVGSHDSFDRGTGFTKMSKA